VDYSTFPGVGGWLLTEIAPLALKRLYVWNRPTTATLRPKYGSRSLDDNKGREATSDGPGGLCLLSTHGDNGNQMIPDIPSIAALKQFHFGDGA
jgi:hypothetical protein